MKPINIVKGLVFATILILRPAPCSAEWWITTVDSNAYTDSGADICLDSLGCPSIAYGCETKGAFFYASWNPGDSTWTKEHVGHWGSYPRLLFDSKWQPHAIWFWSYAYKDTAGWHWTDLSWAWNETSSFAIDKNDDVHVGCVEWYSPQSIARIFYCWLDSTGWHLRDDTVEVTSFIYPNTSITVDDTSIHLAYSDYTPWGIEGADLIYATKSGGAWHKECADTTSGPHYLGDSKVYTHSLAFDTAGVPCIAYRRKWSDPILKSYDLRYATKTENGWEVTIIDSVPYIGGNAIHSTSLCIDKKNHSHIVYSGDGDLKYAWFDGISWDTTTIDTGVCSGWPLTTGIVIDDSGYVHISYQDDIRSLIKYARGKGRVGVTEVFDEQKLKQVTVMVHPNPFTDETIIDLRSAVSGKVETLQVVSLYIYDMSGRLVKETRSHVVGKELRPGVYFVKTEDSGTVKMTKIGRAR